MKKEEKSKKDSKSQSEWVDLNNFPPKNQRIIVFDIETTGLNHLKHQINEIAAIEIENGKITGQQFHIYIKQRVPSDTEGTFQASKVKEELFNECYDGFYDTEKKQMKKFLDFVDKDSLLVTHNGVYEYYFLEDELNYLKLKPIPKERFRATQRMVDDMVKSLIPDNKSMLNLEACCDFFGLKGNEKDGTFHSALYDTFMIAKLYIKLLEFQKKKLNQKNCNFEVLDKIKKNPSDISSKESKSTKGNEDEANEDQNVKHSYIKKEKKKKK